MQSRDQKIAVDQFHIAAISAHFRGATDFSNNKELIVAEVLQRTEAMKGAVGHLEQYMEKPDSAARGKIVLATVKGDVRDVHDIGKNLADISLSNSGYTVVNLGTNVPLLVGCAALSEKFTKAKIVPSYEAPTLYAKGATTGLRVPHGVRG